MTQPKLSLFGDAKAYSEGRAYRRPTDGSNHPSVTTILKVADKSGLIQWAVDRAVDWCVENWMTLGERSDVDAKRIARFQHNKVRDDRAEVGDGVHAWVEAEHTDWNYPELNDEQEQIVQQWEILKTEYEIEPVLTEFTTFIESDDGANTCMGTADGFWRIDGIPTLIDVKGLPLDTPIPTPDGWTTMGKVSVGDKVFGSDGKPAQVTHKSNVHHNPTYEVFFDDGTSVVCDEDHRWVVHTGPSSKLKREVLTVREILGRGLFNSSGQRDVRVYNSKPLDLPDIDLPIDPYVLGAWLGDGTSENGCITKPDQRLWDEISNRGFGYSEPHGNSDRETSKPRTVYGLRGKLDALGLLKNKHVPDIYFRASMRQRLDLLRGLMDTDGSYNKKRRRFSMSTTTDWQVDAVHQLCVSLGWKAYRHAHPVSWTYKGVKKWTTAHSVEFVTLGESPFLVRNQDVRISKGRAARRTIRKIEKTPEIVPTQCISVDSKDHTYLCTGDMIPTHNTSNNTWPEHYAQLAALSHGKEWYEQIKEIPPEVTDVSPKKMQAFLEEHWQKREMPEFEALALIHLKKDMREIVWVPMEEVQYHWSKFEGYMKVWSATEELKAIEKGRKLAQKEEW